MNLRKHLVGIALFLVIFGSTVLIFNLVTGAIDEGLNLIQTQPASEVQLSYQVPYVSLDFINQQSYTNLTLDRKIGRYRGETLWVRTYFFAPDYDRRVWASEAVEVRIPSDATDRMEIMSTAPCEWCSDRSAPRSGYFARVIVSHRSASDTYLLDSEINRGITTATPVVVQVERKLGR